MASIVSRTIPVLGTAGVWTRDFVTTTCPRLGRSLGRRLGRRLMRARHGFALKLALLLTIFVCVPAVLYGHFRTADQDKQQLILKAAQERGRMTLDVITPLLGTFDPGTAARIGTMLSRMGSAETQIRVLFRPANLSETDRFYYIASAPEVSSTYLDAERKELVETGIFRRVPASCMQLSPTAARYTNPAGKEELLVSLHSVNTSAGCWVVITSTAAAEFLGTGIGRSYWQTPEMRLALIIYLFMAACVVMIFLDVWGSIRGFSNHARKVRTQNGNAETFAAHNEVPELDGVAGEFDRMVGSLRHSAQMIRFMAEDNAHAFKTPIAVIAQSLEPVKRSVGKDDARTRRSLEMIEHSVHRLDSLVSAARRMDEAAADIVDPMREPVDIAQLMRRIGDDYAESLAGRGIDVRVEADSPMTLFAQQDLLETVLENLLENAASFTPQSGTIRLFAEKRGGTAILRVEDEGPGVGAGELDCIFDRYYSNRSQAATTDGCAPGSEHFGVGLWIVRRNVEAIGGTVTAENLPEGGFAIHLALPLVP